MSSLQQKLLKKFMVHLSIKVKFAKDPFTGRPAALRLGPFYDYELQKVFSHHFTITVALLENKGNHHTLLAGEVGTILERLA